MTKILLFLAPFLFLAPAWGSTITVTSNSGIGVRDSQGELISGGAIRVGFLDLTAQNTQVIEDATEFSQVDALWTPLAEGTSGGGNISQSGNSGQILIVNDQATLGEFFGQITDTSSLPQGTQLFLWLFNDPDPSQATEWAIVSSSNSAWKMPNVLGITTLSTSSIDQIFRGTLNEGQLNLAPKDPLTGFDAWLASQFTPSQLSGPESEDLADPDQDNWSNLAEYVFGMNPLQFDNPGERIELSTLSSGTTSLNFSPIEDRDDVFISAFTSPNLLNWTATPPTETSPGLFSVPLPAGGKGFAQLRFTR